MSDERRKVRLLLRTAAVLFAVALLSGFVPIRAGISYDPASVGNCGSFFIRTERGGDEGCEGAFFDLILWWAGGALLLAVLLVLVAAVSSIVDRE
jgi:hypothetical protein